MARAMGYFLSPFRACRAAKPQSAGAALTHTRLARLCDRTRARSPPRARPLLHRRQLTPLSALRLPHSAVRHVAVIGIHALADCRVTLACALETLVRQFQEVREGGVGERKGRGVRDRSRYVGDAIVQYAIDDIRRLGVGGGVRLLKAPPLIDTPIHSPGPAFHAGDRPPPH